MLFVVWTLTFLIVLWVLDAMGIRNVRSVAKTSLSRLMLGPDELHNLENAMASHDWKHGRIYKSVVADLAGSRSD